MVVVFGISSALDGEAVWQGKAEVILKIGNGHMTETVKYICM